MLIYLKYTPDPLIDVEAPEIPGELVLYRDLRRLGLALPCGGGYFDQPWTLMQDLRVVETAIQHRTNNLAIQAEQKHEYDDLAAKAKAMAGL